MRLLTFAVPVFVLAAYTLSGAEKYSGPRPAKADVPYLLHADTLIETEVGAASQEARKDSSIAVVAGAGSPVKTPLSEPTFIIRTDRLQADKFELYRLESKNGKREVVIGQKKGKGVARAVYLQVTRIDDRLYKIEVDEPLENGEYSLTPQGSDQTFSFGIY
ncbi:MAG: hypothetical protein H7039_17225 [Bryobacteraceae bacterium]|nr:hypothetical protein [Bryobacteraceae bacterium]